jgi:hypothetical protein
MTIADVFEFYNKYVKPVYSKIEAKGNVLPIQLLFEIHSAFDHLKRSIIDHQPEEECCKCAKSHLKRGLLDAYKLELKFFNDDYNKLTGLKAQLGLIDSGRFLLGLVGAREKVVQSAKKARLVDKENIDILCDAWSDVSLAIAEIEDKFFSRQADIEWTIIQNKKSWWRSFRDNIVGNLIAAGIISLITFLLTISFWQNPSKPSSVPVVKSNAHTSLDSSK